MVIDLRPWGEGREGGVASGVCYLIEEPRAEASHRLLASLVAQGRPALVVTRQHPSRLKAKGSPEALRTVWLSHTPSEGSQNPMALGGLTKLICNFIAEHPSAVVLLDGLEYLTINNGFAPALLFIEGINEFVMQHDATVLVPVSPGTLEPKELALLERALEVMQPGEPARGEGPTRDELVALLGRY
jgi:hypothetical protein